MKSHLIIPIAVVALAVAACGPGTIFNPTPSIRGSISTIIPSAGGDELGFVRIEGSRSPETQYDRADVAINKSTTLLRRRGGSDSPITFDSLRTGLRVEATFTGQVLDSYPVRATARELVVLE